MRHIEDWNAIQEKQDGAYDTPAPGGYIAEICSVTDNEQKEYLEICWDFTEGQYTGANRDTFIRAGFWPTRLFRSYKESALGFFKAFKTAVEESNPGYIFDDRAVDALRGKKLGIVLGEEEYRKNDGTVGTRLSVVQVRSVRSIRDGDFKIPDKKRLKDAPSSAGYAGQSGGCTFAEIEDDGELPF